MKPTDTFQLDKATIVQRSKDRMREVLPETRFSTRQKLALTCRILFDNGHDSGLAGQITARAAAQGQFHTQQLGMGFDEISDANLLLVDEDLTVLDGVGMPNPANRFHSWVYRARPDVNCIIHTHAVHAAALGMREEPLVISHMDNCVLYDSVAFVADWPGVPVGNEEGVFIAGALGGKRALLLSHHGLLIAGTTVEEACVLAIAFERAARMQLLAGGIGNIKPIDPLLGAEARDWVLQARRNSIAFDYYARRSLKLPHNADCLLAENSG